MIENIVKIISENMEFILLKNMLVKINENKLYVE